MQDFTLTTYKKLLHELLASGYFFQTLLDFIQRPEPLSRQFWELAADAHGKRQRSEDRCQRSEGQEQETENGKTEVRGRKDREQIMVMVGPVKQKKIRGFTG